MYNSMKKMNVWRLVVNHENRFSIEALLCWDLKEGGRDERRNKSPPCLLGFESHLPSVEAWMWVFWERQSFDGYHLAFLESLEMMKDL